MTSESKRKGSHLFSIINQQPKNKKANRNYCFCLPCIFYRRTVICVCVVVSAGVGEGGMGVVVGFGLLDGVVGLGITGCKITGAAVGSIVGSRVG